MKRGKLYEIVRNGSKAEGVVEKWGYYVMATYVEKLIIYKIYVQHYNNDNSTYNLPFVANKFVYLADTT